MESPQEADIPPVAFEVHKQKKQKTEKACSSSQAGAALPPAEENLPLCALGVQSFGGSLGHLSDAAGSTAAAAQPSLQEADAARLRGSTVGVQAGADSFRSPSVRHVAVDTRGLNPLHALLEVIFLFWCKEGWSHTTFLFKGQEPTFPHGFEEFLQQPDIVKCALRVWLEYYAWDLPEAAMVSSWLALWFRDLDYRAPDEEARLLEQMCLLARTR
jgi:hypothetical protein